MHLSTRTITAISTTTVISISNYAEKDFWLLVTKENDFSLHKALKNYLDTFGKMVYLSIMMESVLHTRPIYKMKLDLLGQQLGRNLMKGCPILPEEKRRVMVVEWLIVLLLLHSIKIK